MFHMFSLEICRFMPTHASRLWADILRICQNLLKKYDLMTDSLPFGAIYSTLMFMIQSVVTPVF